MGGLEAERAEHGANDAAVDGWVASVSGGDLGDEEVGVRGGRPPPCSFAQPGAEQAEGELVEIDDVRPAASTVDGEPASGSVEVVGLDAADVDGVQGVDGDQRDGQLGGRAPGLVDQAAELVGRDGRGQSLVLGEADPTGRVPENDPYAFERPEQ